MTKYEEINNHLKDIYVDFNNAVEKTIKYANYTYDEILVIYTDNTYSNIKLEYSYSNDYDLTGTYLGLNDLYNNFKKCLSVIGEQLGFNLTEVEQAYYEYNYASEIEMLKSFEKQKASIDSKINELKNKIYKS